MGGLAVLHPQDSLRNHLPRRQILNYSHMKPHRNHNPSPNSTTRSHRTKRSPEKKNNNKSRHTAADNSPAKKNLVVGEIKILKRGEELTALKNRADEKKAGDSKIVPKQMRIGDFYAGTAVVSSPPPSSVPFPAFFAKKPVLGINEDASSDLRRLLGLDMM